ncbi:hypothetical protein [Streptomyces echinatus]|uniref:hypothetical protein n=1 Tax=Streptomyces echinatus TaxID=67293 RepID=UPI0031F0F044
MNPRFPARGPHGRVRRVRPPHPARSSWSSLETSTDSFADGVADGLVVVREGGGPVGALAPLGLLAPGHGAAGGGPGRDLLLQGGEVAGVGQALEDAVPRAAVDVAVLEEPGGRLAPFAGSCAFQ